MDAKYIAVNDCAKTLMRNKYMLQELGIATMKMTLMVYTDSQSTIDSSRDIAYQR